MSVGVIFILLLWPLTLAAVIFALRACLPHARAADQDGDSTDGDCGGGTGRRPADREPDAPGGSTIDWEAFDQASDAWSADVYV